MERIKLIEEKAKLKLKKIHPLTFDLIESVREADDWVFHIKKCMKAYVECFSRLKNMFDFQIQEDVKQDIQEKIFHACWDISSAFAELTLIYVRIMDKQSQLLTVQAKQKIDKELEEYWKSLEAEFEQSKKELKKIHSHGIMANIWQDERMQKYKKYFESFLELSFEELKNNLNGSEDALGKIDDILDN